MEAHLARNRLWHAIGDLQRALDTTVAGAPVDSSWGVLEDVSEFIMKRNSFFKGKDFLTVNAHWVVSLTPMDPCCKPWVRSRRKRRNYCRLPPSPPPNDQGFQLKMSDSLSPYNQREYASLLADSIHPFHPLTDPSYSNRNQALRCNF
jgi:hypothetical protein